MAIIFIIITQSIVLILSFPLKIFYKRFIKTPSGLGRFHLLKNKVLGDAYQRPDWPYAYFPIALAILNFFFSAITVYFWIVKTYRQTVDEWMLGIEYAISGFFMMHYFANMLKSEFALSYVLDIDSGIDLWTIVPVMVQSQLNTWLSWSYIRVYCLYRYFKALMAIGYNPLELSDVTEQMIGSFFKFLTMVTILSGTMFVFEVLGPIKGFEDKFIATEMGDISFMSMFYFMLTTISTVGYGDLSPVTLLGRFLTFICVINGVFFFSVESGRILELQKRESQGGGRYKPVNVTKTSHAVIIGGAVENSSITILSSVLEELCNPSVCGGEEFTPDVVLLGNRDLSVGLRDIISKKSAYMKRVYTLTGTAFEEEDMQRARVKQCAMLFILPNQATADPDKEDQHQILLASAVLKVHPEIPLRLVLLRPESRRLASQFKISRANCYALNEFKSNLLAQSMRCPGITTLLFGLTHYTSEVDPALLKLHTWIPEYTAGTAHQIYGGILIPEYSEQSFTTIVKQVYNETGAVMLAVQSGGRIVTNPGKSTIVVANAVVFLMATSRNQLESILQPGNKWIFAFQNHRKAHQGYSMHLPAAETGSWRSATEAKAAPLPCDTTVPSESKSPDSEQTPAVHHIHPVLNFTASNNIRVAPAEQEIDKPPPATHRPKRRSSMSFPGEARTTTGQSLQAWTEMDGEHLLAAANAVVDMHSASGAVCESRCEASSSRGRAEAAGPVCETTGERGGSKKSVQKLSYQRVVSKFFWDVDTPDDEALYSGVGSVYGASSVADSTWEKPATSGATSLGKRGGRYPAVLQLDSGHLVVLAVGPYLQQQLVAFIKPLRADYLVVWREIVIVSNYDISEEPFRYPGVHHINEDPLSFATLHKAFVHEAYKVVILDGSPPTLDPNFMDQRTILCNGVLESFLEQYPSNSVSRMTVLHTPHSIKQLVGDAVPDATSAGNEEEEEEEELLEQQRPASYVPKGHCSVSSKSVDPNPSLPHVRDPNLLLSKSRRKQKEVFGRQMTWKDPTKRVTRLVFPPDLHPHFVGGCSVALPDIMRFVAHTFHTPGAMELIQALLKPGEEKMPSMMWVLPMEGELQRLSTWDELVTWCLEDGAIPLALFRKANMSAELKEATKGSKAAKRRSSTTGRRRSSIGLLGALEDTECAYVVNNPPKYTVPTHEDKVLVLASARWAYVHCISKEICEVITGASPSPDLPFRANSLPPHPSAPQPSA
ncbi:hypothetical protein CYMTET_34566 [Cymbomonas tetramitiformis]|uniref:Uncharacterized protein n=1 Tax=Cymbomonas tetramitiformis TaxID=36881 RepID=A0AAE0FAP6_9CHLO|nr:hypothetical protein CYMTET_34566 [Cymbomonas tetramitiformis]